MRAAVLIIGSLYWSDVRWRVDWRKERLDLDGATHLDVSIRYGRKSGSDTYTMTFASGDSGKAILVPCSNPLDDCESLIQEAEALWTAEASNKKRSLTGTVGGDWGCVGVLFREPGESHGLRECWAEYFTTKVKNPAPVTQAGILDIPWPTTEDGRPMDVDCILATANKPLNGELTPEAVADAWIAQDQGHERYFFNNVLHGIRTSWDEVIWRRIESRQPEWLGNSAYAEAVGILNRR